MKIVLAAVSLMLLTALQAPVVLAKSTQDNRQEADQLYQQNEFKKAYKIYFKLAKKGDHYCQDKISQMYANGDGRKVDLTEAYAWSVLASESGSEKVLEKSNLLFQEINDKSAAQKRAAKLKKKYGRDTLAARREKYETMKYNHKSGGCTGSRLGCG